MDGSTQLCPWAILTGIYCGVPHIVGKFSFPIVFFFFLQDGCFIISLTLSSHGLLNASYIFVIVQKIGNIGAS